MAAEARRLTEHHISHKVVRLVLRKLTAAHTRKKEGGEERGNF